jgi:SulP family sulfate permease
MVQLTLTPEQRIRERLVGDPPCDRLLFYGLEGEVFFGAEPELDKHFTVIEQAAGANNRSQESGIRNQASGVGGQESARDRSSLVTPDSRSLTPGKVRAVILVLHRARNPDAAFLNLLEDFNTHLRQRDIALVLAGVQPDLSRALAGTGLAARIGVRQIFCDASPPGRIGEGERGGGGEVSATSLPSQGSSTWDAIHFAYGLLGESLCSTCPRRKETPPTDRTIDYVI